MKSISKNKHIWPAFIRAIDKYHLIEEGDKIAVCISVLCHDSFVRVADKED